MDKSSKEEKFIGKISKSLLIKTIILGSLILTFVLFIILANLRYFCEGYSASVVKVYRLIFGHIASFFPFSIFETFLIGTAIYSVAWIVFFVRNTIKTGIKKTYHMIMRLGIIAFSILTVYQGTAGIEYSRYEIKIPQDTKLPNDPLEYKKIAYEFLEDFNNCASQLDYQTNGSVKMPYSKEKLIANLEKEFGKYKNDYMYEYTPKAKPLYLTSWFYTIMSISGVSFSPTGEANYNVMVPDGYLPFTIAHEMAHSKGVMPEENANLVAAYICLNSGDPYIRFSGYNVAFWSLEPFVRVTNIDSDIDEFYDNVDNKIYFNNYYEYEFWKSHATFEKIADWLNDLYLKFNKDEGTVSYSDNIDVVVDEDNKFTINSLSRYQALFMWIHNNKTSGK